MDVLQHITFYNIVNITYQMKNMFKPKFCEGNTSREIQDETIGSIFSEIIARNILCGPPCT